MKLLIPAVLTLIATPVLAVDVSAPTEGVAQHVEGQGLGDQITGLQAKITSATARLFAVKDCHSKGFFYRTLSDGTEGCKAVVPCQAPWGEIVQVGASVTAYQAPAGACVPETRTCGESTGVLSGSFQYPSCN